MCGEGDSNEAQSVVNGGQGGGEVVPVNVRRCNGSKFNVRTRLESTVDSFKALVAQNCDVPPNQQRFVYMGRLLKDDHTLLSYGLQADHAVYLVRGSARASAPPAANAVSQTTTPSVTRGVPNFGGESLLNATTMSGNAGSNPFAAPLENQGAAQGRDASNNPMTANAETGTGNAVPNSNPLPNPWGAAGGQTSTSGRMNSGGDTRAPGLGGLGMLGGDPTVGATPDASQMNQLLQNPAMSQMMQSLLSNPQYMNQIMSLNPQLRSLMDSSPQVREMMQNPEFLRMLSSPDTMQQMMSLQQSLLSGNRTSTRQVPGQTGAITGNNGGLDSLMNVFGGGLSGVPPEELHATQLQQLEEMGFLDRAENIRALRATNGNVNTAVERLLGSIGQ